MLRCRFGHSVQGKAPCTSLHFLREFDMKNDIVSLLEPELVSEAADQWDAT
jgi:hypothetical protein